MAELTASVAPRRINWSSPLIYVIAYLIVVVSVVPVLYVWLNGFRSNADINADPAGWPNPWYFQNFLTVLGSDRFWGSLFSSTVVAGGTTVGVCVLGIMAAFVIAKYDFRGRQGLYTLFAAGLMFPLTVASLPLARPKPIFAPRTNRSSTTRWLPRRSAASASAGTTIVGGAPRPYASNVIGASAVPDSVA